MIASRVRIGIGQESATGRWLVVLQVGGRASTVRPSFATEAEAEAMARHVSRLIRENFEVAK